METNATHNEQQQATASENIKSLFESAKVYGKTNFDLLKLKTIDKASEGISSAVAGIAVAVTMLMFFLILNIGIALLLGNLLGRSYYGFFALAGFYLITGLILNAMKTKWFKIPVANMLVKKFLK